MVEFKDPPPAGRGAKGRWVTILEPLVQAPGRWAKIATYTTPEEAWDAADNLRRRNVLIPKPDANWEFISRSAEVFAKYGRKRASVRRNQRKG